MRVHIPGAAGATNEAAANPISVRRTDKTLGSDGPLSFNGDTDGNGNGADLNDPGNVNFANVIDK